MDVRTFGLFLTICVWGVGNVGATTFDVEVASGRKFAGEIDPRTDDERLWLRMNDGGFRLTRPIEWSRVVRATSEETWYTVDELRKIADEFAAETAAADVAMAELVEQQESLPAPPTWVEEAPAVAPRVRSIDAEAYLGHWNATPEVDGFWLHVLARDEWGAVVPARGTLTAELLAMDGSSTPKNRRFPLIGRWTRSVRAEDLGPEGMVYRLEFQAVHPEFAQELIAHGMMTVRLSVPGQGTFDATVTRLRIRPYSRIRDELQHARGERFHPRERPGRTH